MTGVGPTGPVIGPTGKLYVTDDTDGNVYVFGSSGGVASLSSRRTATPLAGPVDLAFTPDGRLYGTEEGAPNLPDGIVVGNGFLLVNRNDGNVSEVPLAGPHTPTTIVSGGSRGDIASVGSDGCGYFTQSDRVFKLTNANGSCSLTPAVRFNVPKPPAPKCSLRLGVSCDQPVPRAPGARVSGVHAHRCQREWHQTDRSEDRPANSCPLSTNIAAQKGAS
jgi:hypothetical protein